MEPTAMPQQCEEITFVRVEEDMEIDNDDQGQIKEQPTSVREHRCPVPTANFRLSRRPVLRSQAAADKIDLDSLYLPWMRHFMNDTSTTHVFERTIKKDQTTDLRKQTICRCACVEFSRRQKSAPIKKLSMKCPFGDFF